jgi:putative transposase
VPQFAPATYFAARSRPPSARRLRDEELRPGFAGIFEKKREVYGVDKVWTLLNWEQIPVARCPVGRLMRAEGRRGMRPGRGGVWKTTIGDDQLHGPADLVDRNFTARAPNCLWVADLTI